jgi:hypothetical protein
MKSFSNRFWTSLIQVNMFLNFALVFSSLYFFSFSLTTAVFACAQICEIPAHIGHIKNAASNVLSTLQYRPCLLDTCDIPFLPSPQTAPNVCTYTVCSHPMEHQFSNLFN